MKKKVSSGLQEEYQAFFNKKLKTFGVDSPEDLSEEEKKRFFNEVELEWEEGVGPASVSSTYERLSIVADALAEVSASTKTMLSAAEAAEAVFQVELSASYPPAGNPSYSPLRRLTASQKVVATIHDRTHNVLVDIVEDIKSVPRFSAFYGDSHKAIGSTAHNAAKAWSDSHEDARFGDAESGWKRDPVIGMTVKGGLIEPGAEVKIAGGTGIVQKYVAWNKYYVFAKTDGKVSKQAKLMDASQVEEL